MDRFSHLSRLALLVLALAACGKPPPAALSTNATVPQDQLARIVERYWDERIPVEDVIDPQILADSLSVERRYLALVAALPRDPLDGAARLNFDIFKRQRESSIEGFTYPSELMPLNPFGGALLRLALESEEIAQYPFSTAAEYDQWLKDIDGAVAWSQRAMINMRDGVRRGYTSPRAVVARMLALLERLGSDSSTNVFYAPMRAIPDSIPAADRARVSKTLSDAVAIKLLPAIRSLHDFVTQEYLPRTRHTLAMTDLPLGASWYAYRVRRATGAGLSPADVHRLGLAEIEKIKFRLHESEAAASAPATLPMADLLIAYQQLSAEVRAHLEAVIASPPDATLEILATDISPEPAAPLSYLRAAVTGKRPAVLYIDNRVAASKPTIAGFLRNAMPGSHLQDSVQRDAGLPRFRRFNAEPAFVAGWGLYAASLGEEMGLYADEGQRSQLTALQMRCAVGLVVDTGLHALSWTRAQALDYLRSLLPIDDAQAQSIIDGYLAMPADALACSIGEIKIEALRSRSQQTLGPRFDIREFHLQLLKGGAMPLDILDAEMKAWTESVR